MKRLGIVICNYNKEKYIVNCIQSVLRSSFNNFDIYVVDNASSDNSIQAIENEFGTKVNLIKNKENLGGSGGFNTGIESALKNNYKYIMLLDNDVEIDSNAIYESISFLDKNKEVAVVGSKIYSMDNPTYIQEMGANIDFEKYIIKPFFKGCIDNETIPEIVECDYVPACSMIVRVSAMKEVGLMPQDNFIYWDDIEWGYRFKLNGYKVVAIGASKVWHKMGVNNNKTTFGTYYFWRNRVRFFMKYCSQKQRIEFAKIIFEEMMKSIYICNYIGKYSSAITITTAILDAINGISGKAGNGKVLNVESIQDVFKECIKHSKKIYIIHNTDIYHLIKIIDRIENINKKCKIIIKSDDINLKKQLGNKHPIIYEIKKIEYNDLIISTCNHILDINEYGGENHIIVDKYFNIIKNNENFEYIKKYSKEKEVFNNIFYPILLNGMKNFVK